MRGAFGDDDPRDRPDDCFIDHLIMDEEVERNIYAADERANEKHNLSELF